METDRVALVERIERTAREAALAVCWSQWQHLGAHVEAEPAGTRLIDPEALLLLSLALLEEERRLVDLIGWWAEVGASLISVQRLHNVAGHFPQAVQERVGAWARLAATAGDRRWTRHQSGEPLSHRPGKGADQPMLARPAALMLRLRSGFGVGAKADLLAFLLARGERGATIREAALALDYTEVALRGAAQPMARAFFIDETRERPASYRAPRGGWMRLLRPAEATPNEEALPRWGGWTGVFAFLADVLGWAKEAREAGWSDYVRASRARDLFERHAARLTRTGLGMAARTPPRGAAYLEHFAGVVEQVARQAKKV